jgi:hypothetical protein
MNRPLNKKFNGAIGCIIIYTLWYAAWAFFMFNGGARTSPHNEPLVFTQYAPTGKSNILHQDTIYFNDSFSLARIPGIQNTMRGFKNQSVGIFYNKNPQILLWLFLLISLSSVSCAFVLPLLGKVGECMHKAPTRSKSNRIIIGSFLFSILIFAINRGNYYVYNGEDVMKNMEVILQYPFWTIIGLVIPVFIVAFLCIGGLLISAYTVHNLLSGSKSGDQTIEDFRRIRNGMNQFLIILGIVVASGSVVTTSALRNGINHLFIGNKNFEILPVEFVYIYSLVFTLFIVVVYVPIYYIVTNTGKAILERVNPFSVESLTEWNIKKTILEEQLGLNVTLKQNLSAALVVISPVISAILSQLLGKQ